MEVRSVLRRLQFEFWYYFRPPWDTGVSPPELISYLDTHTPGHAIDLGCGTGTNALTMIGRGWSVVGVDFSPSAIRRARRKLKAAGLDAQLVVADLTAPLKVAGPFDFALDVGCFHSLDGRQEYLLNLAALLRMGGHWLMYGFLPTEERALGVAETDLDSIRQKGFELLQRANGYDGSSRPSAWFLFEKARDAQ